VLRLIETGAEEGATVHAAAAQPPESYFVGQEGVVAKIPGLPCRTARLRRVDLSSQHRTKNIDKSHADAHTKRKIIGVD
jgi:hypothetical protein